jgi:hypothetical protein
VDKILDQPQVNFAVIQENYPFYWCGRGKQGHAVYYERPGELNRDVLVKQYGFNVNDMIRHWLYVTEYTWKYIAPGEMDKTISVIDMGAVTMSSLSGEPFKFLNTSIQLANHHYPERSFVIFIVHAPNWFSFLWKMIKGFIHENTQKKIRILSKKETLEGLMEHIDIENIPIYYGGKLDCGGDRGIDSCRFYSPEVVQCKKYTDGVIARAAGNSPFSSQGSNLDLPPGTPGENHPPHRNSHSLNAVKHLLLLLYYM